MGESNCAEATSDKQDDTTVRGIRAVWLSGGITTGLTEEVLKALWDLIEADKEKPIALFINSDGGTVVEATALYDFILASETPIDTYALGEIKSAAVLVFVAGRRRYTYPNTLFMLHKAIGSPPERNFPEVLRYAEEMSKWDGRYAGLVAQRIKLDSTAIRAAMEATTFFGAEEALEWGVCDEIVGKNE